MTLCDWCGRLRRCEILRTGSEEEYGDTCPMAVCFLCRREAQRGRMWSTKESRYMDRHDEDNPREARR